MIEKLKVNPIDKLFIPVFKFEFEFEFKFESISIRLH